MRGYAPLLFLIDNSSWQFHTIVVITGRIWSCQKSEQCIADSWGLICVKESLIPLLKGFIKIWLLIVRPQMVSVKMQRWFIKSVSTQCNPPERLLRYFRKTICLLFSPDSNDEMRFTFISAICNEIGPVCALLSKTQRTKNQSWGRKIFSFLFCQ